MRISRALVRIALSGALGVAVVLLTAMPAAAHYKLTTHQWWFGGSTYSQHDLSKRIDPVNMFFHPHAMTKSDIDSHFNAHWGPNRPDEWIEDQNLPGGVCKGDQLVRFRGTGPPRRFSPYPNDFHGAGVGREEAKCFNRYHIRFWGDANHEQISGTTHSSSQAWILGGAHYEEVLGPRIGHAPALDWDVVEHRIVRIMRPHAYHIRWRCLPNSFGLYQGYRSDGRLTRLSMRHGTGRVTPETESNGQC
jgi:hypothetical protein